MNNSFAGTVLKHELATVKFRGEEYNYTYSYFIEPDGQRYTTAEIDEGNVRQVYDQYRAKYGIPSPEDIAEIKEHYGLSNAKLAAILGFGENQIANYLDGEVPSLSNGRTLAAIRNPLVMEVFVDNARGQIGDKAYGKIKERIAMMKESLAEAV